MRVGEGERGFFYKVQFISMFTDVEIFVYSTSKFCIFNTIIIFTEKISELKINS